LGKDFSGELYQPRPLAPEVEKELRGLVEPFDATIATGELADLTPTAQALINSRQATALWFLQNIGWISGALAALGLGLLLYGIILWSKKQRLLDEKEKLETEKLKREIENMTPIQIAQKAINEAAKDLQADKPERIMEEVHHEPTLLQEYFHLEETLISKLKACFGRNRVLDNMRITGGRAFDVIVLSEHLAESDVIFELKAYQRPTNLTRSSVRDVLQQLRQGIYDYKSATNHNASGILLYVVLRDLAQDENRVMQYKRMAEELTQEISEDVAVHVFTPKEFNDLGCDDLKSMVFPTRKRLHKTQPSNTGGK